MSKLIVFMSMSLDGLVAAEGDDVAHGLGVGGEILHDWLAEGEAQPGSHRPARAGVDAEVFDEMLATGAVITGRRTFDHGGRWSGDHHDGVPIFVLTRDPSHPPVGHARYTSDLAGAVTRAREAAGDRDVMVHGASSVRALMDLGAIDEFMIHLVPVLLGRGRRLFDDHDGGVQRLRLTQVREGAGVLHLRYRVTDRTVADRTVTDRT